MYSTRTKESGAQGYNSLYMLLVCEAELVLEDDELLDEVLDDEVEEDPDEEEDDEDEDEDCEVDPVGRPPIIPPRGPVSVVLCPAEEVADE